MPIDRFYTESVLKNDCEFFLEEQEFHHLYRVTRTREGEQIEIVNGKGQLAEANVERIEKRKALLKITQVIESPPSSFKRILIQAIPKLNRLEMIVEKGTELGMEELWLFPGERSEKKQLPENQLDRLKTISISAMKQCGRLYLPSIVLHPPLQKWKTFPSPCYFGDLCPEAPSLFKEYQKSPHSECVFFAIGPESGFSDNEIEIFRTHHAKGIFLNENILRTDTAAIAALAILGVI